MKGPEFLRRYSGQAAFLTTACSLGLLILALLGAGRWAFREFTAQAAQYQAYNSLQKNAGVADSLSDAYAGLLESLETTRTALPPENQASHVLNLLVEEARRLELGISGVSALDQIPFPGYVELPFEVGLTGAFPNLVRYLHSLETRGMVLRVRRLAVTNEPLNRFNGKTRLDLSVFMPGGVRGSQVPAPGQAEVAP